MFEQTFKNIDDVLWKNAYTEQTSRILFLKYLDDLEQERTIEADLKGMKDFDWGYNAPLPKCGAASVCSRRCEPC